ncbi:MAG: DEAD/DEAH box helicase, partial [Spirochaetes bacterium]|nr:DEAD/DEAH box helicase [Spirochaetota bacterium]
MDFKKFHPLIQKWFEEKYQTPTDIQLKAWQQISRNEHVLITAPTGSGKTFAAFLWAINQLASKKWLGGQTRVLYISPLKALNNDIKVNLLQPLAEIKEIFEKADEVFPQIKVQTRSGDTLQSERQKMLRHPPEILITTPETLNILLTSKNNRNLLRGIATVILDEIHALIGDKRGSYLISAIERMTLLSGEFQRIALSATVKPLEKVADFVGGYQLKDSIPHPEYQKRKVHFVRSDITKKYKIKVAFPSDSRDLMIDDSVWPVLIHEFKKILNQYNSTLFFANSRRITEKISRMINEEEKKELAYSHHSSLSKEIRLAVEQKLKQGELKAIVATNSLELGIDIGHLDQVVLIQSPMAVSSAIQRIGRAGHQVGEVSEGTIYPTFGRDFLDAAVIARCVMDQDIEEFHPAEAPLDILAQVILSMCQTETWNMDDLYHFIKTIYPYRNLLRKQFDLVLKMLTGQYADSRVAELSPRLSMDKIDGTVTARRGTDFLLYLNGGTIPERGHYQLRLEKNKARIGELDEEFVWERKVGETFNLGNQIWRIQRITHNDVEVVPTSNPLNIIPFWRAEELNRGFHLSEKIALFLEQANHHLNDLNWKKQLQTMHYLDDGASQALIDFLKRQLEATGTQLPHRHHLVIEHYDDPFNKSDNKQVILHTLWGGRMNHPFALALSAYWKEKYGYALETIVNNDCILLMMPHDFQVEDILTAVKPENLENFIRLQLENTGFFGAKFRENAGRAILLTRKSFNRRVPLWQNRLRAKKLLNAVIKYPDFPIVLETWREFLQDEFDLENLKILLDELASGVIKVSQTITQSPSPFADGLIWKQTNKYMYEDDRPYGDSTSNISDQLIKDLIFSSDMHFDIPPEVIEIFTAKRQRTAEGYAPDYALDLMDWIKERLLIEQSEWDQLLTAIQQDGDQQPAVWLQSYSDKIAKVQFNDNTPTFIVSIENLPFISQVFQINQKQLNLSMITTEKTKNQD